MILESQKFQGPEGSQVLVLIHGMGSASSAWKPIIPELIKAMTVVTLDLPGHGKTPMSISQAMDPRSLGDAVCETMTSLGIEKFHLCGNSLGGWVALEVAAKHSGRVLSVTGLAPAGLWLAPSLNLNGSRLLHFPCDEIGSKRIRYSLLLNLRHFFTILD